MSNICHYTPDPNILTQAKVNREFALIHKTLCFLQATAGSTGLTSVGITSSSPALTISGSPLIADGDIDISFNGDGTQLVLGNGFLTPLPNFGTVTSVSGTSGRIEILGTATDPVVNIDPSYEGQSSITTLGDVSSGVWQASSIDDPFIASAPIWNAKENALTFSTGLTRTTNTITNNLSTGLAGGQSVIGGTAASNNLTLSSTASGTKGKILVGTSAYDEVNNRLGIGQATPTARLHIAAGTATASTAPLKLTSGTNLTTPEAGAFEFDSQNLFFTVTSTRFTIPRALSTTAVLDFPSTLAGTSSDLTISISGASIGDIIGIGVPVGSVISNTSYSAFVSSMNTVTVRFNNYSIVPADPASGTFRVSVVKYV